MRVKGSSSEISVIKSDRLTNAEKYTLLVMCVMEDRNISLTRKNIEEFVRVNEKTLRKHLDKIVELGWAQKIENRVNGRFCDAMYQLEFWG